MNKRIIITEAQHEMLRQHLAESTYHSKMVEEIKNHLDFNYEPMTGVVRQGGEYSEQPMIKIKADNEAITPKALYEYLTYKYKLGGEFLKQIIRDWLSGGISDNHQLTKNVSMS